MSFGIDFQTGSWACLHAHHAFLILLSFSEIGAGKTFYIKYHPSMIRLSLRNTMDDLSLFLRAYLLCSKLFTSWWIQKMRMLFLFSAGYYQPAYALQKNQKEPLFILGFPRGPLIPTGDLRRLNFVQNNICRYPSLKPMIQYVSIPETTKHNPYKPDKHMIFFKNLKVEFRKRAGIIASAFVAFVLHTTVSQP